MISPDHEWLFDSTITSTAHGLALGRKGAHRNGHNLGSAGMLRLVYPIKPLFGTVNASFGFCLVRNHISFMAKNWECKPEQTWERLNRLPEGQRRGLPPPRSESFFLAEAPSSAAPSGLPHSVLTARLGSCRAAASRSRTSSTSPITVHKAAGRAQRAPRACCPPARSVPRSAQLGAFFLLSGP